MGLVWEIYLTTQVEQWLDQLLESGDDSDTNTHRQVVEAVEALTEGDPNLGRPLVDRIRASAIHNLKELRPGSARDSEVRILFTFDPWRSAILLVAGDKAGRWRTWYLDAVPEAEDLYAIYLKERAEEEETP